MNRVEKEPHPYDLQKARKSCSLTIWTPIAPKVSGMWFLSAFDTIGCNANHSSATAPRARTAWLPRELVAALDDGAPPSIVDRIMRGEREMPWSPPRHQESVAILCTWLNSPAGQQRDGTRKCKARGNAGAVLSRFFFVCGSAGMPGETGVPGTFSAQLAASSGVLHSEFAQCCPANTAQADYHAPLLLPSGRPP